MISDLFCVHVLHTKQGEAYRVRRCEGKCFCAGFYLAACFVWLGRRRLFLAGRERRQADFWFDGG
jgi:hypothetical protein